MFEKFCGSVTNGIEELKKSWNRMELASSVDQSIEMVWTRGENG